VSGRIVAPDPAALGAAYSELLADQRQASAMGRAALATARALDMSWRRVVTELTR